MEPVHSDRRFPGFDGLRALAILLVIGWHSALGLQFPLAGLGWLQPIVLTGWAGVDVFFALSGFLITSLLLREEQANRDAGNPRRFAVGRFYARRALRILPIFFVVMSCNFFLLCHVPFMWSNHTRDVWAARDWPQLISYATLLGNYWGAYAYKFYASQGLGETFQITWSLCVEEHFYLIWPPILLALYRFRTRLLISTGICLAFLLLRYVVCRAGLEPHVAIHIASHYRIDSILWGALAALFYQRHELPRAWVRRLSLTAVLTCLIVLVARHDLSVFPPGSPLGLSLGFTLLAVFSTLLVLELRGAPGSLLARGLDLAPLRGLGRLSYAMYLTHFWAIDLARVLVEGRRMAATPAVFLLLYVLVVSLSVGVAAMLHLTVEKPFLSLKAHFAADVRPRPQPAVRFPPIRD